MRGLARWLTPHRLAVYPLFLVVIVLGEWAVDVAAVHGRAHLGPDFLAFYSGGALLATGHAEALVSDDGPGDARRVALQQHALGGPTPDGIYPRWLNPPYAAYAFAPLGLLPYGLALALWYAVSLGAFVLALALLRRALALERLPLWRLVVAALAFYPTLVWLMFGQSTALWLLVYASVFVLLRGGRDFAAGLVLGLMALKPQLGLGLGLMLLVARRGRALVGAALTGGSLIALGWATLPDVMRRYAVAAAGVLEAATHGDKRAQQHSLYSAAVLLLDAASPSLARVVGTLATLTALLALAALWLRRRWTPGTRAWDGAFALTVALGLLGSSYLCLYDLTLLLLPALIAYAHVRREGVALDGGPLLVTTALLWLTAFIGWIVAQGMLDMTARLTGHAFALQLLLPALVAWTWQLWRAFPNRTEP